MNVLIVRLGALGDVVHAIPVAAALRRARPDAGIDWLVSAKHADVLDLVTVLDRRIAIRDRSDARGGISLWKAIADLRRTRYDVVLDLQGLIKSATLARASGAPRVIGFGANHVRERIAARFYTETYDPDGGSVRDVEHIRHVVMTNLGMLSRLGIAAPAVEFPLAASDSRVAQWAAIQTDGRYALLNPGAAWPNKRWPPARFGAVAFELHARHGLRSIVLWGPGEEPLAEAVASSAAGAALVAPRTTVADLVTLARGAALMISGDTGPMHLAAAVGTPLVGIFGPTRPARNGPLSPDDLSVSRDAICKCHHLRRCRMDRMCLLDIEVSEVVDASERRLASRSEPTRA